MRICAPIGKMSLLSLAVKVFGQPQICAKIPAGAFYPAPKVDSAIVRVDIYAQTVIPPQHLNAFFLLAKAGFQQKRKTLRNSLAAGINLPGAKTEGLIKTAGIDPRRRAETLNIEEWHNLVEVFESEL